MNFFSITIVRAGDCMRSVKNISEFRGSPISDWELAKKIFYQQIKDLDSGDYIAIYENGICIKELYL